MVTFSPHLRYNSPRLNDLAIRSNEYLRSKRFLLTIFKFCATIPHGIGAPATFRPPPAPFSDLCVDSMPSASRRYPLPFTFQLLCFLSHPCKPSSFMQLRTLLCNGVQISLLFSIACALFLSPRGWYPPASPLDPSQRVASVSPLERTARKIIEAVRPRTHAIIAPLIWVGRVHEADLRRSERGLRGGHYLWAYWRPGVRRAKPIQPDRLAERDARSD